jgi:hypothetical protein
VRPLLVVAVVASALYVGPARPAATGGPVGATADGTRLRHVVEITGTGEDGFHVRWSDGEQWWTPTLSETLAECTEYDRAPRRARCVAGARARYRWMGIVKRSLHHHG